MKHIPGLDTVVGARNTAPTLKEIISNRDGREKDNYNKIK